MRNRYEKVFGIGLNKTGTSSLMQAFKLLGFRHKPYDPTLIDFFFAGRIREIFNSISLYETFEDWPWPLMVPALLEKYGENAKFILTKRSCSNTWVESLKQHSDITDPITNPRKKIYGYSYPHGNEKEHIKIYNAHLDSIRNLFRDCGKNHLLIELCWEEGDGWDELCSHLGMSAPEIVFPHANAAYNRQKNHPNILRNHLKRMSNATELELETAQSLRPLSPTPH